MPLCPAEVTSLSKRSPPETPSPSFREFLTAELATLDVYLKVQRLILLLINLPLMRIK